MQILYGAAAFAGGAAVCTVNYILSRTFLGRRPGALAPLSMLRQVLSVGYLVLLYFLGQSMDAGVWPLLIGGALGVTLPSVFYTSLLLKINGSPDPGKENQNG